jgi:hypothetical protein
MYRPDALVVVVRAVLIPMSVSVTVAPATTAPVGSVTEPATVPVEVDCAHVGKELPTHTTKSRTRANFTLRVYIVSSDQEIGCCERPREDESLNISICWVLQLANQSAIVAFSIGYLNE